jgi:hypothetical protein
LTHNLAAQTCQGKNYTALFANPGGSVTLIAMTDLDNQTLITAHAGPRLAMIAASYARLTGRQLLADYSVTAQNMWQAPRVILAHGGEDDPIFFYGNRMALNLFELSAAQLMAMPSRLSAEMALREERAALLARVAEYGFSDDYAGIRISTSGRRFRIDHATIWNVTDTDGTGHGQAATFDHWTWVETASGGAGI